MFKILVLHQLHNLSDERIEYPIRDWLSFMRFLGLQLASKVSDAKTVWLFREHLKEQNLVEVLFHRFHEQLLLSGYVTKSGHLPSGDLAGKMIDARARLLPLQRLTTAAYPLRILLSKHPNNAIQRTGADARLLTAWLAEKRHPKRVANCPAAGIFCNPGAKIPSAY